MAISSSTFCGPGPGLRFGVQDSIMTLDTGLTCARGDVLEVVMTTVNSSGDLYVVKAPTTAGFTQATTVFLPAYYCVALEAQTTAAGNVLCRFCGTVEALINDTDAAALSGGKYLIPQNASRGLDQMASSAGGVKVVAKPRSATVAATLAFVDFDGIHGFGVNIT